MKVVSEPEVKRFQARINTFSKNASGVRGAEIEAEMKAVMIETKSLRKMNNKSIN
jgi:hypothetical protein